MNFFTVNDFENDDRGQQKTAPHNLTLSHLTALTGQTL